MFKSLRDAHPLFYLRRLPAFRAAAGPLKRLLDFPVFVSIEGMSYPLCLRFWPNLSLVLGRADALESAERPHFRRFAREREARTFWDIGANIGAYSVDFLSVNPRGRVLALEPDQANAGALRRTIRRSRLPVALIEAAASDSEGFLPFFYDDLSGTTGSLTTIDGATFNERHYGVTPRQGRVRAVTLDALLADHPPPDMMKIDVEGAELSVLAGAARVLRDARPLLMIEVATDRAKIRRLLEDAGYRLADARTLGELTDESWNIFAIPI
jgi:FkbM family methyltransferase